MRSRFIYVQTILTEDELKALKKKTGKDSVKDALIEAVEHYLRCPYRNNY